MTDILTPDFYDYRWTPLQSAAVDGEFLCLLCIRRNTKRDMWDIGNFRLQVITKRANMQALSQEIDRREPFIRHQKHIRKRFRVIVSNHDMAAGELD